MPRIELVLPGEQRTTVLPVAETYRITVERLDGMACSDMEARTTMSMFCIHAINQKPKRKSDKPTKYGQWYLVKLASGRWSAVWHSFLDVDLEDVFTAIVNEDQEWFDGQIKFARPNTYPQKADALEAIVASIVKEQRNYPSMAQHFEKDLVKARNALRKAKLEAPQRLPTEG